MKPVVLLPNMFVVSLLGPVGPDLNMRFCDDVFLEKDKFKGWGVTTMGPILTARLEMIFSSQLRRFKGLTGQRDCRLRPGHNNIDRSNPYRLLVILRIRIGSH